MSAVGQVDIGTDYLGIRLRSPLVASSSPLTGDIATLRDLEEAGVAAVVLPSLFEEDIVAEAMELDRLLDIGRDEHPEALDYFSLPSASSMIPEQYLELVREAKTALSIPVIGSLNGVTPGWWVDYARRVEEAGADALELNVYFVAADPSLNAEAVDHRYLELVRAIREEICIPLTVKIGPYFSALPAVARSIAVAGANGLVLFNRFYQPDLDLETLQVVPSLVFSRSEDLGLSLYWIGLLHGMIDVSYAATGGVHTHFDVLKSLFVGADVAMLASVILEQGVEVVQDIEANLVHWLAAHEYASVTQMKASVSKNAVRDPTAWERVNYLKTLRSYRSTP